METINNFLDRIYRSSEEGKVLVFTSKAALMDKNNFKKPEIWTVKQVKEYLKYLKEDEELVV